MIQRIDPRYPPRWPAPGASAWGDDRFGLWMDVEFAGVAQRFRWIEPGEFWMGSADDEAGRFDNEGPRHRVRLTQGYWLADTACTQALWQAVMGVNPSQIKGDARLPVESVSWDDCQGFLGRLQALLPATTEVLLPSEAQWEYGCRAGTETAFSFGDRISTGQVNFNGSFDWGDEKAEGEYREKTVSVKSLKPNAWGLYEMHGNVLEWCADGVRGYRQELETDPEGPDGGPRVIRGGSWNDPARDARSADRNRYDAGLRNDYLGLRLALRSKARSGAAERP